ncbi:hypothetical protein B0H17DRAFT_1145195 [Mycena rosella]|uniref:Uncharacterized protein n=1 Tax=Mycena rosella TaxID=1033263 RepID=A0AAD7G230_MYCRO|nr:hypothetical protein B0H17DRAFT_1145195 [Mycena rosella]
MEPPSDEEEFSDSIAASVRTTRSTTGKRKSDVTSDNSDADVRAPTRKKPGPKPKPKTVDPTSDADHSESEIEPKPANKKPGLKPKSKPKGQVPKVKKSKSHLRIGGGDDMNQNLNQAQGGVEERESRT